MNIYTIGFTQKSAKDFFESLQRNHVQTLVDIRLNPGGQLAGFSKQSDLPYFLLRLADNCRYVHEPRLAPTKEILSDYRSEGDWARYVRRFEALMDERQIPAALDKSLFEQRDCCLLCSEATPEQCHRRLVAERLARAWPNVTVIHL